MLRILSTSCWTWTSPALSPAAEAAAEENSLVLRLRDESGSEKIHLSELSTTKALIFNDAFSSATRRRSPGAVRMGGCPLCSLRAPTPVDEAPTEADRLAIEQDVTKSTFPPSEILHTAYRWNFGSSLVSLSDANKTDT